MVATQGMVSRAGVIPNGATQDRPGPMARSVYDVAAMMSVIAGWDAEDLMTHTNIGHFPQGDWSKELDAGGLRGKRIGVLREMIYEGPQHAEGREIHQRALDDMRKAGATIVDPVLTGIDLKTQTLGAYTGTSSYEELPFQNAYLARLGTASKWKSIEQMLEKTVGEVRRLPPPDKSPDYLARYRARAMFIALIHETMDRFDLDAIALPYRTYPPEPSPGPRPPESTTNLTSSMGLPAVVVPGGYTKENLPIGIQILGRQHSELTLLKIAHGYEQVSKRRKTPQLTPPLPGERFEY
jgi:Asp-tRNA(Asn)/Glu-tRNA(Gln) amidotransferase A subunit family amidase